ncbi:MAG: ATP-binding cassette domain-containing protein [Actinomycetota bacterium]|nr:ATP-binding cassette domain-containing protein [Actinomycetota bacterium]
MQPTHVRIRGARANNLRSLDIELPRGQLVVVVGRSGSGKSSLVFDTISAEAGYQLNETFPPFVRNRLPRWSRPDVDQIDGLSPVIVIDQRRIGGNARSTVGTITDTWTHLRLLYSRIGEPHLGESNRFSFNHRAGMCPTCEGLGEVITSAVERFLDLDRSLAGGAILVPGFGDGGHWYRRYADIGGFDADTPLRDWTPDEREALLRGGETAARLGTRPPGDYEGIVERFERIHLRTSDDLSDRKREIIERFTRSGTCPDCDGERLAADARAVTVNGRTIGELARTEIAELVGHLGTIDDPTVAPVVAAHTARLVAIDAIGLGYLTLARATTTLSGGESQRIKTVRHLGSSLTGMVYVFDEPTIGLHPADVGPMTAMLERLRDAGNTVVVVEHDPAVMAVADQVVELGPGPGAAGGRLVFQGPFAELRRTTTTTGTALRAPERSLRAPRTATATIPIRGAVRNNLRDLSVDLPAGVLTVFCGVAGSGKSSLAAELADQHDAIVVDQRRIAATRRSTIITFTGIAPAIRKRFADAHEMPAGRFSASSGGACPQCGGAGVIRTDLAFMDGQETTCEGCGGRRFAPEVLELTVDGLSIADVEELTIDEAVERFGDGTIGSGLRQLLAVGLGYVRLGQPLSTLSGGESQRAKVARHLHGGAPSGIYVLDEPTTGLHLSDTRMLLGVLDRLVDHGQTVVVIEHDLEVIRHADWLIDLGPGPGRHGGAVLYEGPVGEHHGDTPTARALRAR